MTLAAACVLALEALARVAPLPRVKALHLPPDPPPGSDRGEFCAIELADGTLGLGFVLLGDTLAQLREARSRQAFAGADALDVARGFTQPPSVRRTIGLAAVNALTRWCLDRSGWAPALDRDSLGALALDAKSHLGMVGHFTPLIPRVLATGARLSVLELKAELAGERAGYRVTLDPDDLRACTALLVTGSTLLNGTLDGLLGAGMAARDVVLLGPTVGCPPDPLFKRGITALGGTWIVDAAAYRDALLAGRKISGASRKFVIERRDFEGWESLLGRL